MNAARNKEFGECREEDKVPVKVKEAKKGHGGRNVRVARQGKALRRRPPARPARGKLPQPCPVALSTRSIRPPPAARSYLPQAGQHACVVNDNRTADCSILLRPY